MHLVTKTYGHELGLATTFRQWRAKSHCRFLHGYALSIKLTFTAAILDRNNWVLDFGGLKPVKAWLCETFDHRLLVGEDDPALELLLELGKTRDVRRSDENEDWDEVGQLAQPLVIPRVGCEGFASYVADYVAGWLANEMAAEVDNRGLRLVEVEVREHGSNSAIWRADA